MPEYEEEGTNEERGGVTVSCDGKTVRSTKKMKKYQGDALHIVSAQLAELGLTYGQRAVSGKSNEIPAVQELLAELDIRGCLVTADAMNCQVETAKEILKGKGDYLLCAKDNQETTKKMVEEYIKDEKYEEIRDKAESHEKNRGRDETRTAYTIPYAVMNIDGFLNQKWPKLTCIGAIHREVEMDGKKSDEWHFYISSRELTAKELVRRARMEWTVEVMHRFLDVQLGEDQCRVEDPNVQRNLNILRKLSLNFLKQFKKDTMSRKPISNIMFDCLLDPNCLMEIIPKNDPL